jgi:hypothetical protein
MDGIVNTAQDSKKDDQGQMNSARSSGRRRLRRGFAADEAYVSWQHKTSLRILGLAAFLAVITLAAYYPVLSHPFVNYDDAEYVTENPHVQQGLTFSTFAWAITSTEHSNWHPATWLSHALDSDLFGMDPAGHHFTSALFHALNAVILFLLLTRATGMIWRSFLVAAIFALHPINVESVAWVAERKTVLCMFFFLLTLAAYGWYTRKPTVLRYLTAVIAYVFALAAKPMAVTLPSALFLLDYWPLHRIAGVSDARSPTDAPQLPWRTLIVEKLPLMALSAVSCVITMVVQRPAEKSAIAVPFSARLVNAIFSYGMYLWKAVYPLRLGVFYAPHGLQSGIWQVALSLSVLVLITVSVWIAHRTGYLLTGWFWYLGTLVPMIGLVQVGEQGMADRYAYLPLLGILVMTVWGLADLTEDDSRFWFCSPWFKTAVSFTALLVLALLTRRQLKTWESSFAMWSHSLEISSENYVAEDFVGTTLLEEAFQKTGQSCSDEAMTHFKKAVRINPQDTVGHLNIGYCEQTQAHLQEAAQEYQIALSSAPNRYLKIRAYLNLGAVYDSLGDFATSRQYFNEGLRVRSNDPELRAGLAKTEADEKIEELSRLASTRPTPQVYWQLGRLQREVGRQEDARISFQRALKLNPAFLEAQTELNDLDHNGAH